VTSGLEGFPIGAKRAMHAARPVVLALAASVASGGSGAAGEVPLASAYGTLMSCVLWQNQAERTNGSDYSFTFLTPTSLTGVEWSCRFGTVTATGASSWEVAATCSGEEDDGAAGPVTRMRIEEAADKGSVMITDPIALSGVRGGKLVVPSCKLPYEEQLRLEMERLKKDITR